MIRFCSVLFKLSWTWPFLPCLMPPDVSANTVMWECVIDWRHLNNSICCTQSSLSSMTDLRNTTHGFRLYNEFQETIRGNLLSLRIKEASLFRQSYSFLELRRDDNYAGEVEMSQAFKIKVVNYCYVRKTDGWESVYNIITRSTCAWWTCHGNRRAE